MRLDRRGVQRDKLRAPAPDRRSIENGKHLHVLLGLKQLGSQLAPVCVVLEVLHTSLGHHSCPHDSVPANPEDDKVGIRLGEVENCLGRLAARLLVGMGARELEYLFGSKSRAKVDEGGRQMVRDTGEGNAEAGASIASGKIDFQQFSPGCAQHQQHTRHQQSH